MPEDKPYKHREAFCLMQYRDEVTGAIEILWNSRDGVTPFGIRSRAGNKSYHVNWKQDRCEPHFIPTPGMRLFVDASPKHAHLREAARDQVEKYWDGGEYPMSARWETKEEAIEFLLADWTKDGSPTVIEAEYGAPESAIHRGGTGRFA